MNNLAKSYLVLVAFLSAAIFSPLSAGANIERFVAAKECFKRPEPLVCPAPKECPKFDPTLLCPIDPEPRQCGDDKKKPCEFKLADGRTIELEEVILDIPISHLEAIQDWDYEQNYNDVKWNQDFFNAAGIDAFFVGFENLGVNYETGEVKVRTCVRTVEGCFVPETRIMLADEHGPTEYVEIKHIAAGDFVYNPLREKAQRVSRVIESNETADLVEVSFAGEKMTVTGTHPMYVPHTGEVLTASELKAGMSIQTFRGEIVAIDSIRSIAPDWGQKVVNIELESDSDDYKDHALLAEGGVTLDWRIQVILSTPN